MNNDEDEEISLFREKALTISNILENEHYTLATGILGSCFSIKLADLIIDDKEEGKEINFDYYSQLIDEFSDTAKKILKENLKEIYHI